MKNQKGFKITLGKRPATSLLSCIFCLLSLTKCTNIERVDTAKVKELVENGEIKRVTPADLNATVNRLGKQLTDSLNKQVEVSCNLSDSPLVNTLTKENNYKIRLLGAKDTTATNLYTKELDVLFAYAYNAKQGLVTESNIQKMGDSLLIYSAPANAKIAERCFNDSENKLAVWSLVFPVGEVIKRME